MNRMTIPFVARADYARSADWVAALQRSMPAQRIVAFDQLSQSEKQECTVAIVANPDPQDLASLPALRWVQSVWAGVERLVAQMGSTDISIVRLVDPQLAATMAEAVLAWTLFLHRDMHTYAAQQQQRQWRALDYVRPQQRRVGILGLGSLGEAAAARLVATGFHVSGWSRQRKQITDVACFAGAEQLDFMLAGTDILICLLPLTPHTEGLLDARRLALLPPDASVINFARGQIIDDGALRAALDTGALKHAVLDVFATEPLPPEQWQWQHARVTVLPHCTAPTDMGTASAIVAENIARFLTSGTVPKSIDIERGY
jgi:glyoxylate/hydroxypyruvate reductase A